MDNVTIKTNNRPRHTLNAWELTDKEVAEFDYYNQDALSGATFFRYKDQVYDLANFMTFEDQEGPFKGWHGVEGSSYFSGVLVRLVDDCESVIVGCYFN